MQSHPNDKYTVHDTSLNNWIAINVLLLLLSLKLGISKVDSLVKADLAK